MKLFKKRIFAVALSALMVLGMVSGVSAATVPEATIDPSKTGSLEIYKYDLTSAMLDSTTTVDVSGLSAERLAELGLTDKVSEGKVKLNDYIAAYKADGVDNAAFRAAMANPDASVAPGSENAGGTDGHTIGNGQKAFGYAIKGVKFSYLKVANIIQYDETESNGTHKDMVLYEINDAKGADLLAALGLTAADAYDVQSVAANGSTKFAPAAGCHYFTSDVLMTALRNALEANATKTKDALEAYASDSLVEMPETDSNGHVKVSDLPLGLYLILETKVPEQVTSTVNPFFVSIPTTSVNGTVAQDGGMRWIYDVVVFPKNETGIPSLEKTVRESKQDTATWTDNENGSPIDDGYAHNATASDGDRVEYQIISKLPAITSNATNLTTYTFLDTLSKGIEYDGNRAQKDMLKDHFDPNNIKIEFFKDKECTEANKVASWALAGGTAGGENGTNENFTVAYGDGASDATTMKIVMTAAGLAKINNDTSVYNPDVEKVHRGFSNCYMRITYSATVNQNADVVYGDLANPNSVDLKWQRSNMDYWDILSDDCHVYTYGIDLTKQFSDARGDFSKVQFKLFNVTDKYWVTAEKAADGLYYVKGVATDAAQTAPNTPAGHIAGFADDSHVLSATNEDGTKGTTFVPSATGDLKIYGLEDDEYIITEVQTDNGYTLLKDNIHVVITTRDDANRACDTYTFEPKVLPDEAGNTDGLYGVWQNKFTGEKYTGTAFAQKAMAHNMLTASATVDGDPVTMLADGTPSSADALVPLTVINNRGFDLPKTGAEGTVLFGVIGIVGLSALAAVMFFVFGKKKKEEEC